MLNGERKIFFKSYFLYFTPNKALLEKILVIAFSVGPPKRSQLIQVLTLFWLKSPSGLTVTKVPLLSKRLSMAGTRRCY